MKALFTIGLVLVAQSSAAQQVVPVRSGAHEGFSRLVLTVDPDTDWQLDTSRGRATLSFPTEIYSFSTNRIFDRIAPDRIVAVHAKRDGAGSDLELELACKCEVKAYAYNGNYIVIDVFDGPALEPESATESQLSWQPDALPQVGAAHVPLRLEVSVMDSAPMQPRLLPDPPAQEATPASAEMHLPEPSEPDIVAEMSEMAGAVASTLNTEVVIEDDPEMLARIEAAQDQLLAQLTRAADQGLVEFAVAPVALVEAVVPEAAAAPEKTPDVEPVDPELMQQLSARTAYSQGTEDALSEIVNQFAMPQCLDDEVFSMEGWGGDTGFSTQLAMLRSRYIGEFDVVDLEITKEIVQLYLRFALGAEAGMIISEVGEDIENANIYKDISNIIKGKYEQVSGPVTLGAGCGGMHEMWYLAAGLGGYQVLEPLSITEAFSTYPLEVRTVLGPPLANAFIERGQVDAAHIILEIVRRADGAETAAQRLAEARVLESQSNRAAAEEIYQDVALSNDSLAPYALLAFTQSVLSSGSEVPEFLLVDIESSAFFNRETEYADPLRLWEIRVRALVNGAAEALAQIEENLAERPHLEAELRQIVSDIFISSTAESIGDYTYAQMVLRYADLLDPEEKGDEARRRIAQEMMGIGLPETALDILAPNIEHMNKSADYLVAAAYVQLFEPEAALALLQDDNSLAAYKIKLDAYLQQEDFTAVAELLQNDHAREISVDDVALRAGDWAQIQAAGAVGTLAAYMRGTDPAGNENDILARLPMQEAPSLSGARALLRTNEESRQFLERVLSETDD